VTVIEDFNNSQDLVFLFISTITSSLFSEHSVYFCCNMKYSIKDNNLTLCIFYFSSLFSYYFLLLIGAIMSNVTLNTKHVEVLVFRDLSGAFVTSVTAFVCCLSL